MASKLNCVVPNNDNIVYTISNCRVVDKGKCVAIDSKCDAQVKEVDELEMIDKRASSPDEAFELCNKYAFCKGFSIRCGRLRRRKGSQELSLRELCDQCHICIGFSG